MGGAARAQAERPADFFNRAAFVVAKDECRALERAQAAERVADALLDFSALGQALRARRLDGRQLQRAQSV